MAARKSQAAARAASPDLTIIPRATDPPPQTASRRALPHTVVWVECTCPGYEGTLIGVCLSFNPAERQAREINLKGQVKRVGEARAAAQVAAERAEATAALASAQATLANAQAAADADPENADLRIEAQAAAIYVQLAEQAGQIVEAGHQTARSYWQDVLEGYPHAMRFVDGWQQWPGPSDPPEPMNLDHWVDHCDGVLLAWLVMHSNDLYNAAQADLLPKLRAAKPTLPATLPPG